MRFTRSRRCAILMPIETDRPCYRRPSSNILPDICVSTRRVEECVKGADIPECEKFSSILEEGKTTRVADRSWNIKDTRRTDGGRPFDCSLRQDLSSMLSATSLLPLYSLMHSMQCYYMFFSIFILLKRFHI